MVIFTIALKQTQLYTYTCTHAHTPPRARDNKKYILEKPGQNFIHYQYDIERRDQRTRECAKVFNRKMYINLNV